MTDPEHQSSGTYLQRPDLTFFGSVSGYFRLWRYQPKLILILFSFMYFGWVTIGSRTHDFNALFTVKVAFGWLAATMVLLSMFLINDAADREIDKVVHPDRPIPRGIAKWRHIYALGIMFLAASIFLSLRINAHSALVALAMAILGGAHYGYFKRHLTVPCSSEIITPIMSALFPYYALTVVQCTDWRLAVILVLFIYFADLAHDLLGGIHDKAGDQAQNVRTFATAFGSQVALRVSFSSFLVAITAGFLLFRQSSLGFTYLLAFSGLTLYMAVQYRMLFHYEDKPSFRNMCGKVNHLGGGYFFLVSGSIFIDFLLRNLRRL